MFFCGTSEPVPVRPRLSLAPQVWHHPLWLLSPGMSALQLQNLATLAAAAAAAQNSASPSNANPLSSNAASLGALASPGNTAATQVGGGGWGSDACLHSPLCIVTIITSWFPGAPPPSSPPSASHRNVTITIVQISVVDLPPAPLSRCVHPPLLRSPSY